MPTGRDDKIIFRFNFLGMNPCLLDMISCRAGDRFACAGAMLHHGHANNSNNCSVRHLLRVDSPGCFGKVVGKRKLNANLGEVYRGQKFERFKHKREIIEAKFKTLRQTHNTKGIARPHARS